MQTLPYFLTSNRLGFRWWTQEDVALARKLWGNHQVTKLFGKEPFTEEQITSRLELEITNGKSHGIQYWPIFELVSDEHIGCCGLRPYLTNDTVYELGFHLMPAFWNKGYATEAARTVIQYAKDNLSITAIAAGHHPDNSTSKHVLTKLGFTERESEYYEATGFYHCSYILPLM